MIIRALALSFAVNVALLGMLLINDAKRDLLKLQLETSTTYLNACAGRVQDIVADLRDDNEIDNLPDSALTDVPREWLLPVPDAGPTP